MVNLIVIIMVISSVAIYAFIATIILEVQSCQSSSKELEWGASGGVKFQPGLLGGGSLVVLAGLLLLFRCPSVSWEGRNGKENGNDYNGLYRDCFKYPFLANQRLVRGGLMAPPSAALMYFQELLAQ